MTQPVRLQLSRAKGFKLQRLSIEINGLPAVNVARPSRWGNPFRRHDRYTFVHRDGVVHQASLETNEDLVAAFRDDMARAKAADPTRFTEQVSFIKREIGGKNLACWCHLCAKHEAKGKPFGEVCPDCDPCHTDVLGGVANG